MNRTLRYVGCPVHDHMFRTVDWLYALFWNHRDPLFEDPRVRRALTLALDRRELHRVLNLPAGLRPFDVVVGGPHYWRGEIPDPLPHDPEKARALLDSAGWRDRNGDGVRERGGRPLGFVLLASGSGPGEGGAPRVAVFVQAQLQRVGVRTEVRTLDFTAVQERLRAGDFQAAFSRHHIGTPGLRRVFGEGGWIGYANPRISTLLDALERYVSSDERTRTLDELTALFAADVPVTYLYPLSVPLVAHRRVQGLSSPFRADPVMHLEDLWLTSSPAP